MSQSRLDRTVSTTPGSARAMVPPEVMVRCRIQRLST